MSPRQLRLTLLADKFAVCRLPLDSELQMWFLGDPFFAMVRADSELTVVCADKNVPNEVQHEAGWQVLKINGTFEFSETGILEAVLKPLADAKIGVFAISTFATDYVMIKAESVASAVAALRQAGHSITRD